MATSRQPPKPRQQKRKRKVESKTNDESSGIINNEDTSQDVVVAKRPCRRKPRENVAKVNSSRQMVHSNGAENRRSGGTSLNADMISRRQSTSKSIPASSSSSTFSVNRKASSILQRMRCSTHDATEQKESNNAIHSTTEEEEASSVDESSDTTRSDVSNCNEINTSHNINIKDSLATMSDDKQTSNYYIAYVKEKRKLQYMILTLIIFGTMLLTVLSAAIFATIKP